jgi:hypothetical protein
MNLKDYFAFTKGKGILSTADEDGVVNSAVYAVPHCMEDGTIAFIMRERKTYENLRHNPHACYLFMEQGTMSGKRIYITRLREEKSNDLLQFLERRCPEAIRNETLHLIFFRINKILPLLGYDEAG